MIDVSKLSPRKRGVYGLLKSIETGDPEGIAVVDEDRYIQHNPQTHEGSEGLATLFKRLSLTNPKVTILRLFEDGDYVFGHTIYDFSTMRIGFEVFRYDGEKIVEHWDNIQPRIGDMVAGAVEIRDLDKTEVNRTQVRQFIENVMVIGEMTQFADYVNVGTFIDHSTALQLTEKADAADYRTCHRLLAEGNFVLSVSEGYFEGRHSSFYDLFRLEEGLIVEHWETTEKVPPLEEWKNDNGKF